MPESGFALSIGLQADRDQDHALADIDCVETVQFKLTENVRNQLKRALAIVVDPDPGLLARSRLA
jgi:hypothetical protein